LESLEDRIAQRAPILAEIADTLVSVGTIPLASVSYFKSRIPLMTRAYFILNETYKKWRIVEGHWTEEPKIAALQCMAIMSVPPFRPNNPNNVPSITEARCNEIYALACGTFVINRPLKNNKSNFYYRMLDIISRSRSETLEPFVVDFSLRIENPVEHYIRDIHPADMPISDSLITIFEALSDREL
jgi:hypothetical protein